MDRPSQVALIRFGKATAATVVLGLCMAFLPLGLAVLMPFFVLPVTYVVARTGTVQGVAMAVIAALLLTLVVGTPVGSIAFLMLLGVGAALGVGLRRRWSFGRVVAATASGASVALVMWGVMLWQVWGVSLSALRADAYASIENAAALYRSMGVTGDTTEVVSGQMRQFVDIVPYLAPGLLGMGAIILAVCAVGLSFLLFRRMRDRIELALSLSGFRLHWSMAYVSIAGLAMLVFSRGDGLWRDVLLFAGIDLLLVSQTLFFLQGLAVVRWFVLTRRVQPGARAGLYVVSVLGQLFLQLTGLLGLFDTWLDCRKRFALKTPPQGS